MSLSRQTTVGLQPYLKLSKKEIIFHIKIEKVSGLFLCNRLFTLQRW